VVLHHDLQPLPPGFVVVHIKGGVPLLLAMKDACAAEKEESGEDGFSIHGIGFSGWAKIHKGRCRQESQ
jgi:hypothetical protein